MRFRSGRRRTQAPEAHTPARPQRTREPVPIGVICRRNAVPVAVAAVLVEALLVRRIGADPALPAFLVLGAVGVVLATVDLATKRLPDALVLPSYVAGLVLLGLAAAIEGDSAPLLRAVLGMVALFGLYLLLALINPAGLGFGDVKLAGVLGLHLAWLSWNALLAGALAGFLLVALVGLVLLAVRRVGRSSELPFGPFMLVGALVGIYAEGLPGLV
ncbi:prepilin peptidase [Pseudonocardia bannensis]|nr:A24 family peptidase [Pseudonocardia bannensis]